MEFKRKLFHAVQRLLGLQRLVLTELLVLKRDRRIDLFFVKDYVRLCLLELLAHELYEGGVNGSVAELGVYRGDFAQYINGAFPDRTLYLFDTFIGFNESDQGIELQRGYVPDTQSFAETTIKLVLRKMKYPDNCVIKQGVFPKTSEGLNDSFCFVSIDADLYAPTYAGLCFFYTRMNPKGYILVHDYNNDRFPGIKDAVRQFSREFGVSYAPVADGWGSVLIQRQG